VETLEENNRITKMFGQHVSPTVVQKLKDSPNTYIGDLCHVTVMFLDIRGFTTFSELKSPEEVISYLNTVFSDLIKIVVEHNGIINKFLGDGFMAVFGAPLSSGEDEINAIEAALLIQARIKIFNHDASFPRTKIGIGLHSGKVIAGNVGSEDRKEYTLIGDTVNVASRVEQLNKELGTTVLMTHEVIEKVKDKYQFRELEPVKVKGRNMPIHLYQFV
jgi:adenylate cyclase